MKVLQLTTHLNIGGIGRYVESVSKALAARGVEVVVASSGGDLEGALAEVRIAHRRVPIATKSELSPKIIAATLAVRRIVRDERIDIIHAHTRVAQVVARLVSSMTSVPYVTTCHGYFKLRARKIFDTWGSRVVAISDAVQRHLVDDLGVARQRVVLVHTGIDAARFAAAVRVSDIDATRRELGLEGRMVVGTIGRLSGVKGHIHLVAAMKRVTAHRPDAACLIVGTGPEEHALRGLALSLGIAGAVVFAGAAPATERYLAAMDVFVFPSVKEGLGLSLLEAMAAGRPCIASDVGGIRDIIKNDDTGLLVPVGDDTAIADAVVRLLNDARARERLGERAREFVCAKFPIETTAAELAALYEIVVKGV